MKKVVSIIGDCIFVVVVIYLCYFIISAAYFRTPSFLGFRMLRVLTDSMEPVFTGGDCILIKETEGSLLAVGDIITFRSQDPSLSGAYNTHRIYDIAKDYVTGETVYYTKGDNNTWEDAYTVLEEHIVGKYVGKLPFGQVLSGFLDKLSEQNFYFLVVIVPIILCLTSSVIQLVKEIRQK